jgi:hypothetical protein
MMPVDPVDRQQLAHHDSVIVAVMQRERIPLLATNDGPFERFPGLAVRTPTGC